MTVTQTVSDPQLAMLQSTAPLNLFLAGVGSGKTHIGGILSYRFVSMYPKCRGGIFANTYLQLTQSTLFRIREYWKSIGITEYDKQVNPSGQYVVNKKPPSHFNTEGHNFDDYYGIISFINGAVIFTGSLDNAIAHYGKEMAFAILDETKDSDETDVKEVILSRLRQKGIYIKDGKLDHSGKEFNPVYFLTTPARVDWLNELFELEKYIDEITAKIYSDKTFFQKRFDNKFVTISSTYHNQHNLPVDYIDNLKQTNSEERFKALVYANPFSTTGGEFYSSFNRLRHVIGLKYNPRLAIHITFDQNTVPYNTALVWQVWKERDNWICGCIDEICLENPRNSTEEVCEEFIRRYPKHDAGLFFYGDASGHNRSTMSKDFKHHYQIVASKLRQYLNNASDRTLFVNPSLPKRRDFMNAIFEEKKPIRLYINESCKHTIADFMYVKQAIDGGKDKHVVKDPESGEKYQKYGHCFTGDTKVITDRGEVEIRNIRNGDYALTRKGYKKILWAGQTGYLPVDEYKFGNKKIVCTDDHKIFANVDYFPVASLIRRNIFCIFAEKRSWKERLLLLTDTSSINIQNQSVIQTKDITKDGSGNQRNIFIDIFGKRLMEKFRKVLQFIILMVILTITRLKIWNLSLIRNTLQFIINYYQNHQKNRRIKFLSRKQCPKHQNGTDQKMGENGIAIMLKLLYSEQKELLFVLNVIKSLKQLLRPKQSSVHENVKADIICDLQGMRVNIMNEECVRDAVRHSRHIDGQRIGFAPVHVNRKSLNKSAIVYDIEVDEEHEFFANGILVHNCSDAADYLICELFKNYFNG